VGILTHEYSPMLGWIRILIDPLGDHLAEPRVFGEPLASDAADRMPTDLDGAGLTVESGGCQRDDIGRLAEADRMLEGQLTLVEVFLAAETESASLNENSIIISPGPQRRCVHARV
jgi:hypothetical protein